MFKISCSCNRKKSQAALSSPLLYQRKELTILQNHQHWTNKNCPKNLFLAKQLILGNQCLNNLPKISWRSSYCMRKLKKCFFLIIQRTKKVGLQFLNNLRMRNKNWKLNLKYSPKKEKKICLFRKFGRCFPRKQKYCSLKNPFRKNILLVVFSRNHNLIRSMKKFFLMMKIFLQCK